MQAPPAFSLTVTRFGAWRGARLALAGSALAVALAWAWLQRGEGHGAVLLPLAAVVLGFGAWGRPAATRLRWDTRSWWVDGQPGQLDVALDLGTFLLLRFTPDDGRRRWVPVQRPGHEAAWHGLRCTVYCARPPADRLVVDL